MTEDGSRADALSSASAQHGKSQAPHSRMPRRIAVRALEIAVLALALGFARYLTIYLWKIPNGDVKLYHDYALAFWTHRPLLHTLPVEYPPLALLPFSLTLLPPLGDYFALYAYWMGALVILGYVLIARYTTRRRAIVYALYLLLGATATLLARFDLVPALLTLGALAATQRRRFDLAYLLLAAGVLLKLYPIFLLPVVLLAHWQTLAGRPLLGWPASKRSAWHRHDPRQTVRRAWRALRENRAAPFVLRGAVLCLGAVAVGFWCALALNPSGAFSGFSYASDRPLQVESTPATLLWLGTLFGIPASPVYTFSSLNYVGPLDAALKPLSAVALLAACALVYWRQARGRLSVGRAFLACLCAVIATNKIFSPQYLIWVLPIVAVVDGFDLVWVAICALTTLDFPILYMMRPIATVTYTPAFMPVVAVRNLLLVGVTLRTLLASPGASAGHSAAYTEIAGWLKRSLAARLVPRYRLGLPGLREGARHVTQSEEHRVQAAVDSKGTCGDVESALGRLRD